MIIFPALDLYKRSAVRLYKGDFSQIKNYGNPLEKVALFKESGATWLHVVDLAAAKKEAPIDLTYLEVIQKQSGLNIQYGGGIRSIKDIQAILSLGIKRVILSTKAVSDLDFLKTATDEFPSQILLSVDVKDNQVAIKAWQELSGVGFIEFLEKIKDLPIAAVVITDVSRDGTLNGPNIDLLKEALKVSNHNVIASGGISTIEDLLDLYALSKSQELLEGAIVGTAIHAGLINLKEAIELCK